MTTNYNKHVNDFLSEWQRLSPAPLGWSVDANGALTKITFALDEPGGTQRRLVVSGSPLAVRFE